MNYNRKPTAPEFSGVIISECESCKEITTIFVRETTDREYCNKCNHKTTLSGTPYRVLATCKCGNQIRAVTNKTDKKMFEFNCKCGCPIPVEFNSKKNRYQTLF